MNSYMPEGPECHAIAARLGRWLEGRRVKALRVLGGRYMKKAPAGLSRLRSELEAAGERGLDVTAVGAKGKLMYITLERMGRVSVILSTMGLSGTWTRRRTKHCDIVLDTDNGPIWFKDQLHYGTLSVTDDVGLDRKLRSLGPDVTRGDKLSESFWWDFARQHGATSVAEALMKQEWLAGVGNYLKAEILFEAGIAPLSQLDDLPRAKLLDLLHALNEIPRRWYEAKIGRGPRQKMRVYGKRRCPSGNAVVRTKTPDSRITHWVPERQVEYTAH